MARRRIELRLIEDRTSRLARFSKRRAGLLKKAREIAVLCDAEVGVIIFSPLGKLTQFSSQASMEKTIQRYQKFLETGSSVKKHVRRQVPSHPKGFACQKVNSEILEVAQRLSDGECTVKLTAYELERLQEQLGGALRQVRARLIEFSMNSIKDLQGREKALLQERRELQLALGKDVDEGDGGRNETAGQQSVSTKNCERDTFRKSNIEGCHGGDDALALQLWCPPI